LYWYSAILNAIVGARAVGVCLDYPV